MPDIDWSDPCAVLAELRPRYYALVSGQSVVELRHNGKVIMNNKTDAGSLAVEIGKLEDACNAKQGLAPRRRVIRAG